MSREYYEQAALEFQRSMKSRFTGDVRTNLILIEHLGQTGRNYVFDKYEHAELRYKTKDGRRTHVGVYDTGGVEITDKENYAKEQHRQQRLGPLVPYQQCAPRVSCWVVWRETAREIIAANPHERPELLSSLWAFTVADYISKGLEPPAREWMMLPPSSLQ